MRLSTWVQRSDLNAFNLLDEPVADRLQSFWGPRMEPIDGGALDKSGESMGPKTKGTAHWRQTQYHLQREKQEESPKTNLDKHAHIQSAHMPILKKDKMYSQVHIRKWT